MNREQTSNLEPAANAPRVVWAQTRQHRQPTLCSVLRRALAEKSLTGLASRHSHQLVFCSLSCCPSTSLRSLRSMPVTGLLRYYGRSDSCPAGSSVALRQHEPRLYPRQVSLLHVADLPIPPSPTTRQALDVAFARYPSAHRVSRFHGSRLHHSLAGSPALAGRIEFVVLRIDRSPPAAPHPASRRRSCSRLQAGERIPGGDFHPSVQRAHRRTRGDRQVARLRDRPGRGRPDGRPYTIFSAHVILTPRLRRVRRPITRLKARGFHHPRLRR
jgi:hypothetical protein